MTATDSGPPEETQTNRWRRRLDASEDRSASKGYADARERALSASERPEIDRSPERAEAKSKSTTTGLNTSWPEITAARTGGAAAASAASGTAKAVVPPPPIGYVDRSIDVDTASDVEGADSSHMDDLDLTDTISRSDATADKTIADHGVFDASDEVDQVDEVAVEGASVQATSTSTSTSTGPLAVVPPAPHVPRWAPPVPQPRVATVDYGRPRRRAAILLGVASVLALLSGILGALWLGERSENSDLRDRFAEAQTADAGVDDELEEVSSEVRTLELENERLQQQLNEMSALVLELPEGRITEISVPFAPTFADEAENGRLIAVSGDGEFIIWGDGVDGAITDTGNVSGAPTGLFAATGKAWVATDSGDIEALSLVKDVDGLAAVDVGPTEFLAPEERAYWTFSSATGEVVRRKKSDSSVTAAVAVPVDVIDLAIGAGSVWALGNDGQVYRINTADLTVTPIETGVDVISITAGPDALWTLSAADGSLRRIDPVSGDVLVTVPVGRDPIDAVFAGTSVWVGLRQGSSLIEVDTRTAAVVSRTPMPSEPTALHQGDTGVFVTTDGDPGLLRVSSLSEPADVEAAEADAGGDIADGEPTDGS